MRLTFSFRPILSISRIRSAEQQIFGALGLIERIRMESKVQVLSKLFVEHPAIIRSLGNFG